ncbi:MAG: hypothetical protein IPG56_12870 [Caulobacteraceae bacterium]|nr:hypothetical protein [Caulobacteraceae bacterium]
MVDPPKIDFGAELRHFIIDGFLAFFERAVEFAERLPGQLFALEGAIQTIHFANALAAL